MKIKIKREIDVPKSFYCDGCFSRLKCDDGTLCVAFDVLLDVSGENGKTIKCDMCAKEILKALRLK